METLWTLILDRTADGRTVYATNYLSRVAITKKTIANDLVRFQDGHIQVLRGKQGWLSLNGCKFTVTA